MKRLLILSIFLLLGLTNLIYAAECTSNPSCTGTLLEQYHCHRYASFTVQRGSITNSFYNFDLNQIAGCIQDESGLFGEPSNLIFVTKADKGFHVGIPGRDAYNQYHCWLSKHPEFINR